MLDRLQACVMRAGGKRALAQRSGISEAQLYRYLNGETVVPSDRLVAIAEAVTVDSHWLLKGDGPMEPPARPEVRPPFNPALLQGVVREFESLLLEYEVKYTPDQRAKAVAVMYEVARLEGMAVDRRFILQCLDFVGLDYRMPMLAGVAEALEYLAYNHNRPAGATEWQDWLNRFDNLMALGTANAMDALSGQLYFARMNGPLPEQHVKRLLNLVVEARQLMRLPGNAPMRWLDVGCGNGRDMAFLHKHAQPVEVRGIDISTRAVEICRDMERAGKLPAGCVQQGDVRNLTVADASMHMVYAKMSLTQLPYIPGSGIGLEAFLFEAARAMAPHGLLYMIVMRGSGRRYLPLTQKLDRAAIETLAADHGLRVARCMETSFGKSPSGEDYEQWLECILQKP